jgi:hypothetical protein
MTTTSEASRPLKQRLIEESRRLAILTVYFFVFGAGLAAYRGSVLSNYEVEPGRVVYLLVQSLVLAKTVLAGGLLHLGNRFRSRRLLASTLASAGVFTLFVAAFTVLEHVVINLIHGKPFSSALQELAREGPMRTLVHVFVMLLAFLPLLAMWETARALGGNKLYNLFFKRPLPGDASP